MEPCKRQTVVGDLIGASCSECGHTNIAHPGESDLKNRIEACVVCTLIAQVEKPEEVGEIQYIPEGRSLYLGDRGAVRLFAYSDGTVRWSP